MANLTESLQTIYDTKIKIKAAIGTNSDIFTEYPDLILNKIEQVRNGVTWEEVANAGYVSAYQYIDISENGEYDTTYSYMVNVNVSDGGSNEPNLLVNAWSGDTVDASSEDTVYEDIDSLLQQTLLDSLQATVDSIDSIIGVQWTSAITPGEWLDCDKNEGVKVYIDENTSAGGYESSTGWLRIVFSTSANGLIRIKFSGTASNSYHTQEPFESNWITFEFYRGA